MSVPEGKRTKNNLEVFVKAQDMALHTIKILSNEKVFDPKIDKMLIDKIKICAYDISAKAWSANKIKADTNTINRCARYSLQVEAIELCDEMLAYVGIAKRLYHVRYKKIHYWAEMIVGVRKLLQAWKESDVKRYGKP